MSAVMQPPRLRLSRRQVSPPSEQLLHPQEPAEEEAPPTPRLHAELPSSSAPIENPSARLRSLLAQDSGFTKFPAPPSETDSDFDPPAPSFARQSLKDVFQRAMRDPGDTPDKRQSNTRRSSFGVGDPPKIGSSRPRSASDETDSSFGISRSSRAATFDILRDKLDLPSTSVMSVTVPSFPKSAPGQDLHELLKTAEQMGSSVDHGNGRSDSDGSNFAPEDRIDRQRELHHEKEKKRENGWNKHLPYTPHAQSKPNAFDTSDARRSAERSRTTSNPSRPNGTPRTSSNTSRNQRNPSSPTPSPKSISRHSSFTPSLVEKKDLPNDKKSHKRTNAQLTTANGAIPPKIGLSVSSELDDAALFQSEPSIEPVTSTPIHGTPQSRSQLPIPDSPDISLPPSPPSSRPQSALDTQRLYNAINNSRHRPPSPPLSRSPSLRHSRTPSPPSPPFDRHSYDPTSSRNHALRKVFPIPGLSTDTPGSSDRPAEGESSHFNIITLHRREPAEDTHLQTPARHVNETMKTPRFPGSWGTPAADHAHEDADVTPEHTTNLTLPAGQTPAPPGAWNSTPGSAKRKGILKVRFDEQAAAAESAGGGSNVAATTTGSSEGVKLEEPDEEDDVPSPSNRRSSVRLVDPYGRERIFRDDGTEVELPPVGSPRKSKPESVESPPRGQKKVPAFRVVDAMGVEMDETSMRALAKANADDPDNELVGNDSELDDKEEKSPAELASKLRILTGDLYQDLEAELERPDFMNPYLNGRAHGEDLIDLAQSSRTSRIERMKLIKKLESVKANDEGIYKTIKSLRGLVGASPGALFKQARDSHGLTKGLLWILLLLQLIFLMIMYTYAQHLARRLFITLHYDPFYPALFSGRNLNYIGSSIHPLPHSPFDIRQVGVGGIFNAIEEHLFALITRGRGLGVGGTEVQGKAWPPS